MTIEESDATWIKLCNHDPDAIDLIKSFLINYVDEGFYWRPQVQLGDQSSIETGPRQAQEGPEEESSDEVQDHGKVRTVNSLFTVLREWQNLVAYADNQYLARFRDSLTDPREKQYWKLRYQGRRPHGHDGVWEITSVGFDSQYTSRGPPKVLSMHPMHLNLAFLIETKCIEYIRRRARCS